MDGMNPEYERLCKEFAEAAWSGDKDRYILAAEELSRFIRKVGEECDGWIEA